MRKKIVKSILELCSILVALLCVCICNTNVRSNNATTEVRTIQLEDTQTNEVMYFNQFDNYNLDYYDGFVDFIGYDYIKLSELYDLDLVAENDTNDEVLTKYSCVYDYDNGIVSLSVTIIDDNETSIIDTIYGIILMDENSNFDVAFDVDGEVLLLSELQDAGLIENCGFWSKLKKVWNTTAGKIGTIATVATCAVVGVVCAVVPGGQLVTATCIGVVVGLLGGAVTAGIATYIEEGVVDWEAVVCYAGAGTVVGGVTATVSFKMTTAIKQLFPKSNPSSKVNGFDSYYSFKKEFGKASDYVENGEWHHIVEQQTVDKGINSAVSVYNTQNTVAIPKELHVKISSYYSSTYMQGMTVRQYVNTLSYREQYKFGLEVLTQFAKEMGITPFWL
jgi:hypothetical protein